MAKQIRLGKSGLFAIVDESDYENLIKFNWVTKKCHSGKFIYAKAGAKLNYVTMHRYLLNPKKGFIVDHINGNTLDNRRSNLRLCSYSENALNKKADSHYRGKKRTTIYKGIRVVKLVNSTKFYVCAWDSINKKRKFLGAFNDIETAKLEYNKFMSSFKNEFINSALERIG